MRTLVSASQSLTYAVVPVETPLIDSLNIKFPVEVPTGEDNVIDGSEVYPAPEFVYLIDVTIPEEFINANAVAFVPPEGAEDIETIGAEEYPDPLVNTDICPREPLEMTAVAIPPVPVSLNISIFGGTVYPAPGFMSKILSIELPFLGGLYVIIATADAFVPPTGAFSI